MALRGGLGAPLLVWEHCSGAMAGRQEPTAQRRIQLCSPLHSSLARRGESIISKDVSICPSNFRLEYMADGDVVPSV